MRRGAFTKHYVKDDSGLKKQICVYREKARGGIHYRVLTATSESGVANDFLSFTYGICHIFITSLYNFGNKKQQQ